MTGLSFRVRIGRAAHEAAKEYEPERIWDMWENVIWEVMRE